MVTATATVGRIGVQALVPRTLDSSAVERIRSAVGQPLTDAVPDAFAALEQVDSGAYWVLRTVRVDVRISASEPDSSRSAGRIARAMVGAVDRMVHEGPSPDAVRFAGRAAYVAAYVGVLLDGGGGGWVFERLRPLDGLPVADALTAAARAVETEELSVVEELVAGGRWTRLMDRATAGDMNRLATVIGRSAASPAGLSVIATVREVQSRTGSLPVQPGEASPAAERRLRLLGQVLRSGVKGPETVAAVWAVEPALPAGGDKDSVGEPWAFGPHPQASSSATGQQPECHVNAEATVAGQTSEEISALGAAALLLVPDLDELVPDIGPGSELAGHSRAAGDARALVLAAILGRGIAEDDAAVRLAAGAEPLRHDGMDDAHQLSELIGRLSEWSGELAGDDVLGWKHESDTQWFASLVAQHPGLLAVARALLRRFAAHLPGFGHAGAAYLTARLLPLGGSVRLDDDSVVVELPLPPLHVLLALAGLDAFSYRCRWLDVPVVVVHETR